MRSTFVASLLILLALPLNAQVERPRPYPVIPDKEFLKAVKSGTRTTAGIPGPAYWQNRTDYTIKARILPGQRRLEGIAEIVYHNNSPDTLRSLRISLLQNLHKEGATRVIRTEVTGGYTLNRIAVNGERAEEGGRSGTRYFVNGTTLAVIPSNPLVPGGTASLVIDYAFKIPQTGISGRMGYNTDSLFFIGYWYPQMLVYNDVVGWQDDQFLGASEFYSGFGRYDYTIEMPNDWLVWGTGILLNKKQTLTDTVLARLVRAESSDRTVRIVGPEDFGKATQRGLNGWLTWKFMAENVRDVAWIATRSSIWEAARTTLGNGKVTMAHAFWREKAFRWARSVEYTQQSISVLSAFTSIAYPWPHMTAVEGGGIMGGGMEFPMMTLIGDFNRGSDLNLLGVTAHEEAHMWVPMIVNTDERRHGWMDEGITTFHTVEALRGIVPDSVKPSERFDGYVGFARDGREGEVMRRSDFHYPGGAWGVASYGKPAAILHMLRGVLGEELFLKAFRTFLTRWAWKHPYPWDLFNTFATVSGKNLDWFVRPWYYENWTLDQAIADVQTTPSGASITIEDNGWVPMPVLLTITRANGTTEELRIPETQWLSGRKSVQVSVASGSPVTKVEIDPMYYFADVDRKNNVWSASQHP